MKCNHETCQSKFCPECGEAIPASAVQQMRAYLTDCIERARRSAARSRMNHGANAQEGSVYANRQIQASELCVTRAESRAELFERAIAEAADKGGAS